MNSTEEEGGGGGDDSIPVEQEASTTPVRSADVAFEDYYKHTHTTSADRSNEVLAHVGQGGVKKRASIFAGSPTAAAPVIPTKSPAGGPQRRQSAFSIKMNATRLGEKCERCNKTVYAAEKVTFSGGLYHKSCFQCGLDSGNGCGRSLDASSSDIYGGIVYCKSCSKKQHHEDKQVKGYLPGVSPGGGGTGDRRASWNQKGRASGGSFDAEAASPGNASATTSESSPAVSPKPVQSLMGLFGGFSMGEDAEEVEEQEKPVKAEAEAEAESPTAVETEEAVTTSDASEVEKEEEKEEEEATTKSVTPAKNAPPKSFDRDEELSADEDENEEEDAFDTKLTVPDSPAGSPGRRSSIDPLPGTKSFHECPFTYPFDKNGAIYWIGSMGGQMDYENPQKTGGLYLEISTLYRGQLLNLTSYQTAETAADRITAATYTNNTSRSWLVVDFGPERQLRPSYYCLKHGASGLGNAIRNWVLEGKVSEDSPWVELRNHKNDTTMREEPGQVAGFELSSEVCRSKFFRIFRITQTGKNSGGNDCLFIGGIEFYGIMKVEKN